jgi:hypothetical protein
MTFWSVMHHIDDGGPIKILLLSVTVIVLVCVIHSVMLTQWQNDLMMCS